jgi:Flp pilus assembly pilin Flp
MRFARRRRRSIFGNEDGRGLAEYGLILGFIAVLCVTAVGVLGGEVRDMLGAEASAI